MTQIEKPAISWKYLLKKIRIRNEARHITGMLLYLDPFFIQVLEGEEAIINNSFNLIKQDSRHHKVSLIYKKPIEERSFSNWSVGFSKISHEDLENIEGLSDFYKDQRLSLSGFRTVKLMNCYISSSVRFCFEFPCCIQNRLLRNQ